MGRPRIIRRLILVALAIGLTVLLIIEWNLIVMLFRSMARWLMAATRWIWLFARHMVIRTARALVLRPLQRPVMRMLGVTAIVMFFSRVAREAIGPRVQAGLQRCADGWAACPWYLKAGTLVAGVIVLLSFGVGLWLVPFGLPFYAGIAAKVQMAWAGSRLRGVLRGWKMRWRCFLRRHRRVWIVRWLRGGRYWLIQRERRTIAWVEAKFHTLKERFQGRAEPDVVQPRPVALSCDPTQTPPTRNPETHRRTSTMPTLPIGLQLYSIREDCAHSLPDALKQVGEMRYDGVEFAGYYDYTADDLKKMLTDNGLKCFGAHRGLDLLEKDFSKEVDFHLALGCKRIFVPAIGKELQGDPQQVADRIAALAEKFAAHEIITGYHNHAWELEPPMGENFWDRFAAATPDSVKLELDAGWAQAAGKNPAEVIRKHAGRIASLHAKPHSDSVKGAVIGEDDVPWAEVIQATESVGGTDYYIVEFEFDNAMDAVRRCLQNLRAM